MFRGEGVDPVQQKLRLSDNFPKRHDFLKIFFRTGDKINSVYDIGSLFYCPGVDFEDPVGRGIDRFFSRSAADIL